jgi:hypothetical protein
MKSIVYSLDEEYCVFGWTGQVEQAPLILKKPDAQTQVFVTLEKISLVEQVEIQV